MIRRAAEHHAVMAELEHMKTVKQMRNQSTQSGKNVTQTIQTRRATKNEENNCAYPAPATISTLFTFHKMNCRPLPSSKI